MSLTTPLPATSRVEFADAPLFARTSRTDCNFQCGCDFPYDEIEHVPGSIVEDAAPVTGHAMTLTGLVPGTLYHLRVQSQDPSGTATSRILTFTAGETPPSDDEAETVPDAPDEWTDDSGAPETADGETDAATDLTADSGPDGGCGCRVL